MSEILEKIKNKEYSEIFDDNYTRYALYVSEERALPEVVDGCKLSQRRALYTMKTLGLNAKTPTIKSARVAATCSGVFHPHGEAVIYPTLCRMVQYWNTNSPFITGQGNFGSILGFEPAAARYCVTGDTLIPTEQGIFKIKDLSNQVNKNKIISWDKSLNNFSNFFDSGEHKTKIITTKSGFNLEGSFNHPVLTAQKDDKLGIIFKWKKLEELELNDVLVMSKSNIYDNFNNTENISDKMAQFLGALVAEGSIMYKNEPGKHKDYRINFTMSKSEFAENIEKICIELFGKVSKQYRDPIGYGKKDLVSLTVCDKKVCEKLLFEYHCGVGAINKCIPDIVLNSGRKTISNFLKYLYEGDGGATFSVSNNKISRKVFYNSVSETLINQIQNVLMTFGIISHKEISRVDKNIQYVLTISNAKDILKFKENIGFATQQKQSVLEAMLEDRGVKSTGVAKSQTTPFVAEFLRENCRKNILRKNVISTLNGFNKFETIIKSKIDDATLNHIKSILELDYYYDTVKNINEGFDRVYSVKVDTDCHSFYGNSFINHNTEMTLSNYGMLVLDSVDKNSVDFIPNYDEKDEEPVVLPSAFFNLLVNGASGIAVGFASQLPPHNLGEVCRLVSAYIKDKNLTIDEILKIMPGPDFPTGGTVVANEGIKNYLLNGKGQIKVSGELDYRETAKERTIHITSVPFGKVPKEIQVQLVDLVEEKKIEGIKDIEDSSYGDDNNRTVIDIVIHLDKSANANLIKNQILKYTALSSTFNANITVVNNKKILPNANIFQLLNIYVNHRFSVYTRRFNAELINNNKRIHILEGYLSALSQIDKCISIIKGSDSNKVAVKNLIEQGVVNTTEQATSILELKLSFLTKLESNKILDEKNKLDKRNSWLTSNLSDSKKIYNLISDEQIEIAEKHGTPRKTEIIHEYTESEYEDLIPEEKIIISINLDGYVKRLPLTTYKVQARGGKGVSAVKKNTDDAGKIWICSSHDLLLILTNTGMMYTRKGYEIPEASSKDSKGIHLANLLSLKEGEKIVQCIPVESLDEPGYILMSTKNGLIKKTELSEYKTNRKNTGVTAIKLNQDDELVYVEKTNGNMDIFLATAQGKAVRYNESNVKDTARNTQGVTAMKLGQEDIKKGIGKDRIAQMLVFSPEENPDILVITNFGYGKKSSADAYRCLNGRSSTTKGISTLDKVSAERNGEIIGASICQPNDRLAFLTTKGKLIVIPSSDIRATGRTTMGVKVVNLDSGDTISSIARILESNIDEQLEEN